MKTVLMLIACASMAVLGLAGCGSVNKDYLLDDARAYSTIGKDYRRYVDADDTLSDTTRTLKIGDVATWKLRIKVALESLEPDADIQATLKLLEDE